MQSLTLSAVLNAEDDGYVVLCPELDIASQGDSIEQALANLKEAVEGFFSARRFAGFSKPKDSCVCARRVVIQSFRNGQNRPRSPSPFRCTERFESVLFSRSFANLVYLESASLCRVHRAQCSDFKPLPICRRGVVPFWPAPSVSEFQPPLRSRLGLDPFPGRRRNGTDRLAMHRAPRPGSSFA